MDIKWIIVVVIFVIVIALFIYMIVRNQKDKKRVIDSMNEPEIEDMDPNREAEL